MLFVIARSTHDLENLFSCFKNNYEYLVVIFLWSTMQRIELILHYKLGTCESEISIRIESRIESAATIRIQIESRIESADSCLQLQS